MACDFAALRRDVYVVSFDKDDVPIFTNIPFSALEPGDLFTLEAPPWHFADPIDPLAGQVAVERLFRARSEPYMSQPVDGEWLIDCERV